MPLINIFPRYFLKWPLGQNSNICIQWSSLIKDPSLTPRWAFLEAKKGLVLISDLDCDEAVNTRHEKCLFCSLKAHYVLGWRHLCYLGTFLVQICISCLLICLLNVHIKIQILQYVDYVNCYIYILFLVLFIITEQMVYRVFASAWLRNRSNIEVLVGTRLHNLCKQFMTLWISIQQYIQHKCFCFVSYYTKHC